MLTATVCIVHDECVAEKTLVLGWPNYLDCNPFAVRIAFRLINFLHQISALVSACGITNELAYIDIGRACRCWVFVQQVINAARFVAIGFNHKISEWLCWRLVFVCLPEET